MTVVLIIIIRNDEAPKRASNFEDLGSEAMTRPSGVALLSFFNAWAQSGFRVKALGFIYRV